MKIAVLCPSPVPYQYGGIERLAFNITRAINEHSRHKAELLKIPFREDSVFGILEGYYRFLRIKADSFDAVISLKYPAWIVRHDNHILYMTHKLRGLYDTYGGPKDFISYFTQNPLKFPGIHIRKLIQILDNYATKPSIISRYFTISKEVSVRENYFPYGAEVEILYPPTDLCWEQGDRLEYRHIFTVSRLDTAKRIDIIIKSMRFVDKDIELFIAGEGTDKQRLQDIAKPDGRIKFLGHINDRELREYYKRALVVPFIPYVEDFGLVALEAMKYKKPVITFSDSGGATELVKESETGFIVQPSPKNLADRINYFIDNPKKAVEFGEAGYRSVSNINLQNTAEKLLECLKWKEDLEKLSRCNKRKILVLSTYTIYPPYGGGKARIYNLYKELSRFYRVFVISLSQIDTSYCLKELEEDLLEISVPMSKIHKEKLWEYEMNAGLPVSDVTAPELVRYTPLFEKIVNGYAKESDILIAAHPYLFPLIRDYDDKQLIYESHNVEYDLKRENLGKSRVGKKLLKMVFKVEREALQRAKMVFVTSFDEAKNLKLLYGIEQGTMATIPNGVNTLRKSQEEYDRVKLKENYKISEDNIVIFLGAWHPPNLEAFLYIKEELCPNFGNVKFIVIGSVLDQYKSVYQKEEFPENLLLLGNVDDEQKYEIFAISDIAINPMKSGSGTNLKMLDFMASGLSVLSTATGARGLDIVPGEHFFQVELHDFKEKLKILLEDKAVLSKVGTKGKEFVEGRYSWRIIADKAHNILSDLFPAKKSGKFAVDINMNDKLGAGWYPPEMWDDGAIVRWTDGHGVFFLEKEIDYRMMSLRIMPGSYKEPVEIFINGKKACEKILLEGWNEIEIDVSRISGERIVVNILSPTWSPHEAMRSPDTRILGAAVKDIFFS